MKRASHPTLQDSLHSDIFSPQSRVISTLQCEIESYLILQEQPEISMTLNDICTSPLYTTPNNQHEGFIVE